MLEKMFAESNLHDYKLKMIKIDYQQNTIEISLLDCNCKNITINVDNFVEAKFTNVKEWGKGTYIVASDALISDELLNLEIQLNSGDFCLIKCKI